MSSLLATACQRAASAGASRSKQWSSEDGRGAAVFNKSTERRPIVLNEIELWGIEPRKGTRNVWSNDGNANPAGQSR